MLASSFNCLNEILLISFNAYDVGNLCRLDVADIVLKQLVVGVYLPITISYDIEEVD
jgi:hypothetical protein